MRRGKRFFFYVCGFFDAFNDSDFFSSYNRRLIPIIFDWMNIRMAN
ncbi:hypothetical protein LEP1GSC058_1978 [Leptospira fainei serovar Hurstbridge str. BUT 6]|uniref:Uncharacterized protein n=1 Tax=Leptospira fainei serovar Hurstbridge str. BUT 6 TaxID=1193011 RepID=S3V487_9LEPT|nr:hypothetical protein LEP1GSC058_1978 [Leptospira fainei serovar Hurstbridge str. BUT 6]